MTARAFSASISVRASIARWICRSTSPPIRMSWRRRSSSCSEKCSFTVILLVCLPVLSSRGLRPRGSRGPSGARPASAADGTAFSDTTPVEHALEEVRLLARGVELRLAVGAGARRELDAARADAAGDAGDDLPVAAVEAVGDAEDRGQLLDDGLEIRVETPPVLVGLLRSSALVVPRERGENLDLVGREARQVAVGDEVVRVPLVLGVADVAADVVEKRAVLQPLALGRGQLVERVRLVEDLERQARDVRRVEDLGVAAPQQAVDAARPDVAVDGHPDLAVARDVVEQQSLPQAPLAHDDRVGAGALQDPGEQQAARHGDVAAARVQARDAQLLLLGRAAAGAG